MKQFFTYLKKPYIWLPGLIIVLAVSWLVWTEEESAVETETVGLGEVTEEISGTVRLEAEQEVELAFEVSGTVAELLVDEGQSVSPGQTLARLDTTLLEAEAQEARANLRTREVKLTELKAGLTEPDIEAAQSKVSNAKIALTNARDNLADVKKRETTTVENAREALLNNDLAARLVSNEISGIYTYTPPSISGTFAGLEPEEYRVTLYRSNAPSGYSFRYKSNNDGQGVGRVSTAVPQPLGGQGLRILFPENFARDFNIEWLIEIPNPHSATYTELKQAYDNAQDNRELTVRAAERSVREAEQALDSARADYRATTAGTRDEQIAAQEAAIDQANSRLQAAESRLTKATLKAPFVATVDVRYASVGQAVSPQTPILSLSAESQNRLIVYVPEVDVANLQTGDLARVRFDAFPDMIFQAEVVYISPTAREREGVSTFKTRLTLKESDPRLRLGMTGSIDIATARRSEVINVPGRAVFRRNDQNFVRVVTGDRQFEQRPVELGLRGTGGRVEITSGLEAGEVIITFAREEDLKDWREDRE